MSLACAAEFWEARYAERDQIWSGQPNHALITTIADLTPGRALDLGCGEGGDTVWLAARGWQLTAVDISATAIARGRALAARHHVPEAQITWLVEDLGEWQPAGSHDLVVGCFLHSPVEFPRTSVLQRAAAAVVPGGHFLIVSHAGPPPWATGHDHASHRFVSPAEQLAELQLDDRWEVVVNELRPRSAIGPQGQRAKLDDTVLLARRKSGRPAQAATSRTARSRRR
jgi:SAM-dependent methyltransferase